MRIDLAVAVAFSGLLSLQAVSAAEPTATPAAADDNEIVCKKEPQIGKLVKKKRCFTRAEWARISESHRKLTQRLQAEGGSFFDCRANGADDGGGGC